MPLQNQIHVDKLLSNISIKYSPAELIGMKVFPEVPVQKESDLFRIYERNLRIPETERAVKAEAKEHDFDVSTASYLLQRHSLKDLVADKQKANYDISDLRADVTQELTEKILMRMELNVAQQFTTTNWSLNVSLAAANAFNANTTVSDPAPVFHTGATEVIQNAGFKPNFGILPRDAFIACKQHTSVLDRLKYTTAEVDEKKLAVMFDLDSLLVPSAAYDSSALGATSNITSFYGDVAFLGWKPASAGPLKPSAGYVFRSSVPMVKRWRDEAREGEWVEVNMEYQVRVVASLAGYLIKDVI